MSIFGLNYCWALCLYVVVKCEKLVLKRRCVFRSYLSVLSGFVLERRMSLGGGCKGGGRGRGLLSMIARTNRRGRQVDAGGVSSLAKAVLDDVVIGEMKNGLPVFRAIQLSPLNTKFASMAFEKAKIRVAVESIGVGRWETCYGLRPLECPIKKIEVELVDKRQKRGKSEKIGWKIRKVGGTAEECAAVLASFCNRRIVDEVSIRTLVADCILSELAATHPVVLRIVGLNYHQVGDGM